MQTDERKMSKQTTAVLAAAAAVLVALLLAGPVAGLASVSATTSGAAATPTAAATATTATQTQLQQPMKVNFTDCGAKNIKEVRITPCAGDGSVCNINLGTNVTVEADFIAKHEASSLNEIIKGVVRGRELQFPEQRADPCRSTISPSCPIKPGKHYAYKASFEVKPYYPAIPVKVRYALANPSGEVIACVQIAARIVDPTPVHRSSRTKPKKRPTA